MNNRRLFLRGLLVAASAPAIVKAENLMKIVVPKIERVWPDPWYAPAGLMRGEIGTIDEFRIVVDKKVVFAPTRPILRDWVLDPDRGMFFINTRDESTFQALVSTDRRTHRS